MAHSSAARAAVENLTRVLSIEWARFGIRLTALRRGPIATETLRTKYPEPIVDARHDGPLAQLGTEAEFAWLVAYLASQAGDPSPEPFSPSTAGATTGSAPGRPTGITERGRQAAGGGAAAEAVTGRAGGAGPSGC